MADGDHRVFLDALQGVQVQFWTCPNEAHGRVTWTGDLAACDTCGITSEMTGRLIRAAAAYERERAEAEHAEYLSRLTLEMDATLRTERERIYAELGNDHYLIFTEDDWTTEHSVQCRLSGRMSECEYHEAVRRIADDEIGPGMLGRWRITGITEGLPDLERAEAPTDD